MLVHTKAFGHYAGSERVGNEERQYSLLNTLATYAEVKEIFVKVLDLNDMPVNEADVEFQLYNYAEFYPISTKKTDESGVCSFLTGLGDLQIWAYKGDDFNYQKITVADIDTLVLKLNQKPYNHKVDVYDLYPPIQREPLKVSAEGNKLNAKRLKEEDAIRAAYEATFMSDEQARKLADELALDPEEISFFIKASRGNYDEIETFLRQIPESQRSLGVKLLGRVSAKDLRDTKAYILEDHLSGAKDYESSNDYSEEIFLQYLLNPRVANEMLVDYRHYLQDAFSTEEMDAFKKNPGALISWIKDNITINDDENYYNTPITPRGVIDLRIADERSTKIFAVSAFRSMGFPARLEPGTEYLQYWQNGEWQTFHFGELAEQSSGKGKLVLLNDPENSIAPKYHIHFSLAMFENGKYHTLHYDWDKPLSDFAGGVELDAGYYMLVTGNRQQGGSVLHSQEFFTIGEGETITKTVSLRTNDKAPEVIASIDLTATYKSVDGETVSLEDASDKPWQVIAWIDPDKEPTKHTFQDLPQLKKELEAVDIPFTFIIPKEKLTESFKNYDYSGLPKNRQFLIAEDLTLLQGLESQTHKELASQLPVFIIVNHKGEVIYLSSGYKIGIGEEIVKVVR